MKWIALLMLVLCGCASKEVLAPPQLPLNEFAVETLPNGRYLISYKGETKVPSQRIIDLALLKASQITQTQGLDYFVIIDQVASRAGEVKFRNSVPEPDEWNNELLVQGFKGRPHRVFCFDAKGTEQAIYEKFRSAEQSEAL